MKAVLGTQEPSVPLTSSAVSAAQHGQPWTRAGLLQSALALSTTATIAIITDWDL